MAGGDRIEVVSPAPARAGARRDRPGDGARRRRGRRRGAAAPRRRGASCPSTSARRSSCGQPSCCRTTWRDRLNAATMLGQSKTAHQAEIDSACELADFLRFNVHFARQILENQPISCAGVWNRSDYRPLEGFVLAITPFNFTAIAGNLPTAPALMGNVVVWKPSPTQQLAAHHTMRLFEAAGLPPGVINMVTGDGAGGERGGAAAPGARRHPLHRARPRRSSTLWRTVGSAIGDYASYPRLVGETGGKDFVVAHPSADPAALVTGLVRGAFEYQGQKCSAASRAYVPRSLWQGGVRDELAAVTESLTYGDVTDFTNFGGAVIDRRAFDRLSAVQRSARRRLRRAGHRRGQERRQRRVSSYSRRLSRSPTRRTRCSRREYFGPLLAVHVYDDADWASTLDSAGVGVAVRVDRCRVRARPGGDRRGRQGAALRGGQLLCQRQADRCCRRPAALRRCPRVRHE